MTDAAPRDIVPSDSLALLSVAQMGRADAAAIAAGTPPAEAWRGLGLSLLRAGEAEEGRAALKTYLERRPDAKDRAMIAMLAGERK